MLPDRSYIMENKEVSRLLGRPCEWLVQVSELHVEAAPEQGRLLVCPPAPARGESLDDWARAIIESALLAESPVTVVASGFGCLATARAAEFQSGLIEAALMFSPDDPQAHGLADAIAMHALPFPSVIVPATRPPHGPVPALKQLASRWGSVIRQCPKAALARPLGALAQVVRPSSGSALPA